MPSQLIDNDAISFVCAKSFTYAGEQFSLGDTFPQEKARDIEVMVRNRFLVPVVDSYDEKPRHWHREVQLRENVLRKLGVGSSLANKDPRGTEGAIQEQEAQEEQEEAQGEFDVSEHTVPKVLEYVDANPDQLESVIEAEEAGNNRVTLLEALYSRLEDRDG